MIRITESRYLQLLDENIGLCKACGEERDSVEPDAEEYPCEACGESEVYGAEQLLLTGGLELR